MIYIVTDCLLTQDKLLERGAGGHLQSAFERYVPISKLDGLEPVPANNESDDGEYHSGRPVTQPIEVQYSASDDNYVLYAGNHRVAQAKANGQSHILAFVEPDSFVGRLKVGVHAVKVNPDSILDESRAEVRQGAKSAKSMRP